MTTEEERTCCRPCAVIKDLLTFACFYSCLSVHSTVLTEPDTDPDVCVSWGSPHCII